MTQQTTSGLTRRAFCRATLMGAAGLALRPARATAQETYPKGDYVDVHTHVSEGWGALASLSADDLLHWMDKNNVAQSVVLPLINPESWDHPVTTQFVLSETEGHRDRLIPFCSIDPRTINLSSQGKLDLLKRYQDAGCKGFGEHKPGVAIDDPRNIEIFKACEEVGFPILFHMDNQRNTDKPGLPGLRKVLETVPNTAFIGHAQGWWASISGDVEQSEMQGYPEKPVAPGGALDALMDEYPNIYGDLSAGSGANAIMRDMDFGRAFVIRRADRLLFGTDYLRPAQPVPQLSLYPSLELPEDVQAKVFRNNARRLLGL